MKFIKYGGEPINNIYEYVVNKVNEDPTLKVAIGCDSKQLRYKTQYVVTVMFHSPEMHNGAHIVFSRFKIPKIKDRFSRLWKECEYIYEISEEMHNALNDVGYTNESLINHKLVEVHLDLNPSKKYGSNTVYKPAIHWFKSMGYNTIAKPNSHAATSAADMLLK
jgi:predicted RNase H-related nuclease YkuK (DUF458 family)